MTPKDFHLRMTRLCMSSDYDEVKRVGVRLVNDALGENAEMFLLGLETLLDRLRELKPQRPTFGPPTAKAIAEAGTAQGGRVPL